MRNTIVWTLASIAGLASFILTLASHEPEPERGIAAAMNRRVTERAVRDAWQAGQYQRVIDLTRQAPTGNDGSRPVWAWYWHALAQEQVGDRQQARIAWRGLLEQTQRRWPGQPDVPASWWNLGWARWGLDEPIQARVFWARAVAALEPRARIDPDAYGPWYDLACYRALAGDRTGSHRAWEHVVDQQIRLLESRPTPGTLAQVRAGADWARTDPDLADVRGDRRFVEALGRLEQAISAAESEIPGLIEG